MRGFYDKKLRRFRSVRAEALDSVAQDQRVECRVDELEVPLGIIPNCPELFIELNGRSIPLENLKVDPLESALFSKPCNYLDHGFAKPVSTKILGDENVLKIITALATKAGEVRIEHRISDWYLIMKSDKAFDEGVFAEHYFEKSLLGYLTKLGEIFVFRKIAHQAHDGGNFVW
jgi:hypothetical protein